MRSEEDSIAVEEPVTRDASAVFPNETQAQEVVRVEELKKAIGASRFISESELEEDRVQGLSRKPDVDPSLPMVPLAEVLAENKRKKEEEFQKQWKQMKQGKNRPLDPDEFEFIETLRRQESEQFRRMRDEEQSELKAFQQAVNDARGGDGNRVGASSLPLSVRREETLPPGVKPRVRVRVVKKNSEEELPKEKKQRVEEEESDSSAGEGLGGLLGDYVSDSSNNEDIQD